MSTAPLPVAILAGGLATRLRPLTERIPKALLDINGEPFITHQLRLLCGRGLTHVTICAGYLGEMIRDLVGDGASFGLTVTYSFDGPKLLGTAGAVKRALPLLGPAFFAMYGDSYLPCDYPGVQQAHSGSGLLGLMTVFRNDDRYDRSNVEYAAGRIVAYDKVNRTPGMRHIDYGLGVFHAAAFDLVPDDEPSDLATLYRRLLERGQLAGFEMPARFYEIGSHEGLEDLRRYLGEQVTTS